ncbi:tRNA synthetase class I, L, M and V family protein [Prunus dulcis]|uniref:isoleucine--tRNA ligase n=1 Tax=Prunus dulcis TaxID=3755 RepID=A0A4Y1QP18_PRUDU|nr:tRNA synthetase class I, L, M and V family protein [Prunus dulcis]
MESLFQKGLVYKGFKVMPYSTGCKTPLSNFEAGQEYRDVPDPEIMVAFPIVGDLQKANFQFSPMCQCKFHLREVYVVAESRLSALPSDKPKENVANGSVDDSKKLNSKTKDPQVGKKKLLILHMKYWRKYEPLFDYFEEFSDVAFRVVADNYVTDDSGTGVVHCAPAFGEDDYRVCLENKVINKGENLIVAVDDDGCFTERITDFSGRYVKDADKAIIEAVKANGRLVKSGTFTHSYPFCWRSKTPLIYRAVPSWFIRVEQLKGKLLENNTQTYWVPDFVKEKRFHNWLENARDWAVSRSRFWGTPLPVWISEDGEEIVVMDSIEKLEKLSGVKVFDLHRHNIDNITIPSSRGPEYGVLRRIDDVFDCWFESGSMPYAYIHYPFENVELFEKNFPGHFVAEGLDQTRGWFYTLMVNLICNGLVLAEDGKKMSKSLKNYPSPMEVIDDYGADALRLYLINSPVVRAEPLRFKKEGVFGVVKDVFLPWYNAYRFLVQNAKRLEVEGFAPFRPINHATVEKSSNVLDQWINSATQSLVYFVQQEMNGYRLYTVVPYLLKFLDNLTNIYVRFNRKRLKGRTGEEDCRMALSTLFNVLLVSCKVMAPLTPFFTEVLYQNMRKVLNESEESIHFCSFPQAEGKRDERIEQSVARMMTIIDLARNIRERHNKPLKTPLREMVIVHPDADFLDDIAGKLREYVLEELNVRSLVPCNDTLKYASLRAEPDFSVLGKRLGKSMGVVAKEVKAMSQESILGFEKAGEVTLSGHCLKLADIKVVRDFKRPNGTTEKEIDANGDGDVLVILDLRPDESLFEAGIAREIVNRIQKLRKKAALEPTDMVEAYFDSLDQDKSVSQRVLHSQHAPQGNQFLMPVLSKIISDDILCQGLMSILYAEQYIRDAIGLPLLSSSVMPSDALVVAEESFHGISGMSFVISLARPALVFNSDAILPLCSGNAESVRCLQTYLLSRDHATLKSEFQAGNGKITVDCIENIPPVDLVLGDMYF